MTTGRKFRRRSGSTIAYPFFPAYAADWLSSGTRAQLDTEQRGVFWELIFHAWLEEDCGLPTDDRILAAYSGLDDARWKEIGRTVVERAFVQKRDRLFNKRLLKERRIAEGRSRQASRAGRKSGEVRAKAKKKRP